MKKVVITGPSGAIGIALIQKCIIEGIEVLALCHKHSKRITNIPMHPLVKIMEIELDDLPNINVDNNSYDAFFHLGWEGTTGEARDDMLLQIKNIVYTIEAAKLAEKLGCKTFVGAGSQAEYGRHNGMLSPDEKTIPDSGYGMAKLCAGQMSRKICERTGMKHIWARIFSVYGPFDGAGSMVMSTITKMLKGEKCTFTKAEQNWDYIYSSDAANAIYVLAKKGKSGKTYCVGCGQARQLKEYIYQIRDGIDPNISVGIGELAYAEKQVMYLQADISTLMDDTGFEPRVDFKEGIGKTIKWVRETSATVL